MRKLLSSVCGAALLICFAAALAAQTSTIVSTTIVDAGDGPLLNGNITFQPTDSNGNPLNLNLTTSGGGLVVPRPVVCLVSGGAITTTSRGTACNLIDTSLTNPAHFCYKTTIRDVVSGWTAPVMPCVQPTGTTWNLNTYVPPAGPTAMVWSGSTASLSDWTDMGVANGYVPIWNSTTGMWTPGAQSGGSPGGYPPAGIPQSTGSAWGASLTAPVGALVGAGQTNTYTSGLQDFSAVSLKIPAGFASGDCTATALGVFTCAKSNGVAFGAGAFAPVYTLPSNIGSTINGLPLFEGSAAGAATIGVGSGALGNPGTSPGNLAVGYSSQSGAPGAYGDNTSVGDYSLQSNTGSYDVAVGYGAAQTAAGVSNSVFLGHGTLAKNSGDTNEIVLGDSVTGNGSHTATVGDSTTVPYLPGAAPTTGGPDCLQIAVGGAVTNTGNPCPSGSGSMSDGAGSSTANQFLETTTTAHAYQIRTAAQALGDIGADAAGAAATAQSNAEAYSSNASNLGSGTVPGARLPSTAMQTNQANTYGAYSLDLSAATTLKIPSGFVSGDCTATSLGAFTCTKSNGVAFGTGAFAAAYSLPGTVVQTGQANAYTSGLQDFSSVTIKIPSGFVSSDCTATSLGAFTCTKSNGVAFGTGAFATIANYLSTAAAASTYAPLASPTFTGTVTLPAGQVVNGVTLTTGGSASSFLNGAGSYSTPTGSGTVNSGTQYSPAYYPSGGGAQVSGVTPFAGVPYYSTTAAPAAATAAQIVAQIGSTAVANATAAGSFSGSLTGDVTGTQSATSVVKVNGGSVPASANVAATNSSNQIIAATAHNLSVPVTCTTAGSANAYTCTTSPIFTPAAGDRIQINFNVANTAGTATLNVNSTAADTIYINGGATSSLAANQIQANHWISAFLDSNNHWQLEGQLGVVNATLVNSAVVPTSKTIVGANASGQLVDATTTALPTAMEPAHTGDATNTAGSLAMSVVKVNGGSVPASANVAATNSSSQVIAGTAHNLSVPVTCTTSGSANAYTCTTSPTFTPAAGDRIQINFNVANTAGTATLNVNSTSAYTIYINGGSTSTLLANQIQANHWISATLDSNNHWQLEGQLGVVNATQVNGAAPPTSANAVGTNASGQFVAATSTRAVQFSIGQPGGTALSTGVISYLRMPYACTALASWSITVDAGTATVKTWKIASGTAIPTTSNSISTSGVSISTGTNITSTTVSDFTTQTTTAGDLMAANLSAVSGVGFINFELVYTGCTQ